MNAARVAMLLRELADALEEDQHVLPAPPKSKPRRRRRTAAPSLPEPDDLTKQRAVRGLRRRGIAVE